jgi:hypothetical protein
LSKDPYAHTKNTHALFKKGRSLPVDACAEFADRNALPPTGFAGKVDGWVGQKNLCSDLENCQTLLILVQLAFFMSCFYLAKGAHKPCFLAEFVIIKILNLNITVMKNNFRIVIPSNVDEFFILLDTVLLKHNQDGANSELNIINMADVTTKLAVARNAHNLAVQLSKDAETATQTRNKALGIAPDQKTFLPGTVLYYITSVRDYLVGHLRAEEPKLGQWGFEVNMNKNGHYRIPIPYRKPLALISLAESIIAKHQTDGAESPLNSFDMAHFIQLFNTAATAQTDCQKLRSNREIAYKERNNAMGWGKKQSSNITGTLKFYIRAIRDVLLGKFRGIEQLLGEWGFEVITSPVKKKE